MVFRENGEWNQSSPTEYKEETTSQLRGDLCKSGSGHFASEKSFPSNFAQ